ncbi:autotransporter outer membrane beta-barrel domain-containing protein [Bradyrhizobium sp. USDA 4353]
MTNRLDEVGEAAGRNVWMQPLGSVARQAGRDGIPGYNAAGGGLAFGADAALSPRAMIGGVFGYSRQTITGGDDAVPNRLGLSSYQLGLYGAYAISGDVMLDYQLDGGWSDNGESRSLTFMAASAGGSYRSATGHAGIGIKTRVPVTADVALIPSLRLDYGTVRSNAYQESGAGGFSLNVDPQSYQELTTTASLKAVYQLARQVRLTADLGAGYNALNQRLQIGAAFSGGGDSFVTNGLGLSAWTYSAGLGLITTASDRLDLGIRYGLDATPSGLVRQSGHGVLRLRL